MPAHEVRVVIGMTPIQFGELLNTGYFETDREQERRDFARLNGWELEDVPFFKIRDLDTLRVHRLSFKENSSRFCSLKKSSPLLDYYGTSGAIPESVVDPRGQVIVELKSQNIQLQARIDDLENMLSTQAKSEQNGKPRTASATEAAKASRVEEWKGYAVVIAKVGYECGLEDRTQVTRSTYEKLAKRHGGLSKQALELLRDALPEGVTKKTGGPASQG